MNPSWGLLPPRADAIYGARREPTPRFSRSPGHRFRCDRQRHLWSAPGTDTPIPLFPQPPIRARPATPSMERVAHQRLNSSTGRFSCCRINRSKRFHFFFYLILDFPVHFKLTSFSNLKFKANSKLELRPSGTVPISSASINLIAVQSTRCLIFAVQSITMAVNGLELDETSLRLASRSWINWNGSQICVRRSRFNGKFVSDPAIPLIWRWNQMTVSLPRAETTRTMSMTAAAIKTAVGSTQTECKLGPFHPVIDGWFNQIGDNSFICLINKWKLYQTVNKTLAGMKLTTKKKKAAVEKSAGKMTWNWRR